MANNELEKALRKIIREELKAAGVLTDLQLLRKIIREEVRAILGKPEAIITYSSEQGKSYNLYGGVGYYDCFRFSRRYPGYFS